MPFALLLIGMIALVSAVKGTHKQLGEQLIKDFTGPRNFTYWVVAIVIVGSIGYIPKLEKFSRMFLVLCLLSFVILNPLVMIRIKEALDKGPQKPGGQVSPSAGAQSNPVQGGADWLGDPLGALSGTLRGYANDKIGGIVKGFLP